jgi:hypothetical protein
MASLGAPPQKSPAVLGGEAGQIEGNKTPGVYARPISGAARMLCH